MATNVIEEEHSFPGEYSVKVARWIYTPEKDQANGYNEKSEVRYKKTLVKTFEGHNFVHKHGDFESGYTEVRVIQREDGYFIQAKNIKTWEDQEWRVVKERME